MRVYDAKTVVPIGRVDDRSATQRTRVDRAQCAPHLCGRLVDGDTGVGHLLTVRPAPHTSLVARSDEEALRHRDHVVTVGTHVAVAHTQTVGTILEVRRGDHGW